MRLKEEDCIKAMRANEDLIPFIKEAITQSIDGYVRLLTSEFKDSIPIFEKENNLDIYLCLKGPLFHEEGLILERGITKKKEDAFIFRNIERFDEPPLPIPEIHNKEIVPGTNEILKAMHTFDRFGFKEKFIPQEIIKIIENCKDIIKRVASISDDIITIFLDIDVINKNCEEGLKNILDLVYDLEADSVEYDQNDNSIEFEWINKNEVDKMSQIGIEKYYKRFDND
jgi:hypothetical protein